MFSVSLGHAIKFSQVGNVSPPLTVKKRIWRQRKKEWVAITICDCDTSNSKSQDLGYGYGSVQNLKVCQVFFSMLFKYCCAQIWTIISCCTVWTMDGWKWIASFCSCLCDAMALGRQQAWCLELLKTWMFLYLVDYLCLSLWMCHTIKVFC